MPIFNGKKMDDSRLEEDLEFVKSLPVNLILDYDGPFFMNINDPQRTKIFPANMRVKYRGLENVKESRELSKGYVLTREMAGEGEPNRKYYFLKELPGKLNIS